VCQPLLFTEERTLAVDFAVGTLEAHRILSDAGLEARLRNPRAFSPCAAATASR